jgi:regulator of sirC expression with transglutaminase-like and TPR domain
MLRSRKVWGYALMTTDDAQLRVLLDGPEREGCLARAALLAARHAEPELDIEHYMLILGHDRDALRVRVPDDAPRTWAISRLNQFLFEERGFRGNQAQYYDPRNSLLNHVMDRRLGIPITLSILYLELGWGLGLPLEGVSFPGHFLVKCPMERGMVILDPFNSGVSLSEQDLRLRLEQQEIHREDGSDLQDWLRPSDRRGIMARLLRNLKKVYIDAGQIAEAIQVLNLLLVVEPDAVRELRERGNLFRRMECWGAAVADLESALAAGSLGAEEAEDTRQALLELRSRPRLLH